MNIVRVYYRNNDGTIAHIFPPGMQSDPEANTTQIRFDATAYAWVYENIVALQKHIRFSGGSLIQLLPLGGSAMICDATWIAAREAEIVATEDNQSGDVTAKNDILTLATTTLNQINTDNTDLLADLALLPGADNATTKQIIGHTIQALMRNNTRQHKTIRGLQAILRNGL